MLNDKNSYFREVAAFLQEVDRLYSDVREGEFFSVPLEQMDERMKQLYRPMLPEYYENSYLFPPYAKKQLGEQCGQALSALYADLMATIAFAIRREEEKLSLFNGLFLECKKAFEAADEDEERAAGIRQALRSFYLEHAGIFVRENIGRMIGADDVAKVVPGGVDLTDLRYLYRYGNYIGENEKGLVVYVNGLSTEEVTRLAETFVGGYVKGFAAAGKDMTIKDTVKVEYPIGFERVVREAVKLFKQEGLTATFVPEALLSVTGRGESKRGVYGTSPNRRFDFDHKDDKGLYLCEELNEVRLKAAESYFSVHVSEARAHGGPAVIEVFGEQPFSPTPETANVVYSKEQNQLNIAYAAKMAELTNRFIPGEERSYTIIAFPVPEIGDNYDEIFQKIVEVNTLDYELYQHIQQKIIDALDKGESVRVMGAEGNATDMRVKLHKLDNPSKQTNFENCVADVNIPVGEVFTSPVLAGTEGTLFVSHAYLGEYEYRNLKLTFKDGMVVDYDCDNGRKLISDHILHHHESLPIGEFAIGTNTTAYRLARDYGLSARLPILIMEKTGPHFAVGDTCYSYEEDVPIYNPDGKECIARENDCSVRRKSADEKERNGAYFHCHTDITIPFDELDSIVVMSSAGEETAIIRHGRFVLPGTELLNEPLDKVDE